MSNKITKNKTNMEKLTLNQKLLAIQEEVGAIEKDKPMNAYGKVYWYVDINKILEILKPVLNKHKIVLLQPLAGGDMMTVLLDTENDERYESQVTLPVNTDPQKMGAIITYFRRYSLTSLLALEAEDTDANDTAPVAPVRPSTSKALPPMPAGMDMHAQEATLCKVCSKAMTFKEGLTKLNEPYKAYFCADRSHPPIWL